MTTAKELIDVLLTLPQDMPVFVRVEATRGPSALTKEASVVNGEIVIEANEMISTKDS